MSRGGEEGKARRSKRTSDVGITMYVLCMPYRHFRPNKDDTLKQQFMRNVGTTHTPPMATTVGKSGAAFATAG